MLDHPMMLPRETKHIRFLGVDMQLVYVPARTGRDAKGRPWISDEHWYFACDVCGNCGHALQYGPAVCEEAVTHAEKFNHDKYRETP